MSRPIFRRSMKSTVAIAALIAVFILVLPMMAYANSIYVSAFGSDATGNGLSAATAFATVQRAIGAAASGDVVQVGAGTFDGDVDIKDGVSLHGAGSDETTLTKTDAATDFRPVVVASNIGAGTSISDLAVVGSGGIDGIYCPSSSPNITNVTITGSHDGIYCDVHSSPGITNNTITGNVDGIHCEADCSPSITNNTIMGNDIGVQCQNFSSPSITNNTITGNGDGVYCSSSSSPNITNNTITGNSYDGVYCGDTSAVAAVTNCILWSNGDDLSDCSATYSDVEHAAEASGLGNITAAPGFVGTVTGDLHLNAGSPCIDVATSTAAPHTDKDGAPRPRGSGYDMGAYEYHAFCQLHYVAGPGGTLSGGTSQMVGYDTSGSAVTASASVGHHFVSWSDGKKDNPRTDTHVTVDATYTATFALNPVLTTTTKLSGKSSVKVTHSYTLSGVVSRSVTGKVTITITRRSGGTWKSVSKPIVSVKSGKFSYKLTPKYTGTWHFVAKFLGSKVGYTTYTSSHSTTKSVSVK